MIDVNHINAEKSILNDLPVIDVSELEFYEYKQKAPLPTVETSE
jgi:hypothetical protein